MWNFKDNNDLVGMAFIDTQLYIHSLVSIKNMIIAADVSKSVTLLRLQVCPAVDYKCARVVWLVLCANHVIQITSIARLSCSEICNRGKRRRSLNVPRKVKHGGIEQNPFSHEANRVLS